MSISDGHAIATIAESASLSGAVNLQGQRLAAIIMPSAWTTANLTFQAAENNGGTFNDMYDSSGTEITVTAGASRFIRLSVSDWLGVRSLKVRSGTTGSAVNQAAAREIILVLAS